MTTGTAHQGIKLTAAHQNVLDIALDVAEGSDTESKAVVVKWAWARFGEYLRTGDDRSFLNGLAELKQALVDEIAGSAEVTEESVRHPDPREAYADLLQFRREAKAFRELLASMEAHFGLRPSPAVPEEESSKS